jgi:replication factor C subunit 3/5
MMWVEKYRPESLKDLISHEEIISTISNLVKANKLPHLLFHGPPGKKDLKKLKKGTGKTSTIVGIAKDLYGKNYQNFVLELNASDERGIDVIRNQIKEFASTKKIFSSGFKLIILDEADHMTKDAQAALRRGKLL